MSTDAVVRGLTGLSAVDAFRRLSRLPHCLFFDSADQQSGLGRYSYVMADPYQWVEGSSGDGSDLQRLAGRLAAGDALTADRRSDSADELPPFRGGAAGVVSYDFGRRLERAPAARFDEFPVPGLAAGLYDVVAAFEHKKGRQPGRAWLISTGRPAAHPADRRRRAAERCEQFLACLDRASVEDDTFGGAKARLPTATPRAPQHPVDGLAGVTSSFSREGYLAAVRRAVEYIHAGDIFQVNLSQRLLAEQREPSVDVYLRLREQNPAPFAGYADLGGVQVCSASPERFLSVADGRIETRPIKGTRPRSADAAVDRQLAAELLAHPKDRAENIMIVDLLRNDLSRVSTPESVRVPTLCALESYR
ncbi:MAG: chorismate-binding protein, partial [Planctomycetota bacterium]